MSTPGSNCRTVRRKERMGFRPVTCIQEMAAGWITSTDLCPVCARVFMAALDEAAGPLEWHPHFRGSCCRALTTTLAHPVHE